MRITIDLAATPDHIQRCAEMMASSPPWSGLGFTSEQCRLNLGEPDVSVHLALSMDGEVIGFIATMAHGIGLEPLIEYLCVAETKRNGGIGTQLIEFFENTLFPDVDNLYLFVSDFNLGAIKLYERLHYVRVGNLEDFNVVGQTEYLYRKSRRPTRQLFM